ncbi:hypothetical protein MKW94_025540 [Papaver nudicaule]|uniref:Cytochrome P450 n=1 Tax=Papaver nudicaule TaxID=74823 RepID=A0AA41RVF1_PAPNU|nr:hypothetical protein [Papaver nudicaule]
MGRWSSQPSEQHHQAKKAAIPGPFGLPIVGLLFVFTGSLTHRLLAKLSQSCKALLLMAFCAGFTRFTISSQPDTAKEILNSSAFADRPIKESAYELFHRAMGFDPYGVYWRNLRRISATHLFCPKSIASFGAFRREIGNKMIGEIKGLMCVKGQVEIKRVLHFGSLNNVMMSVFGKTYDFDQNGSQAHELEELVSEGYELLGILNWSDLFLKKNLNWSDHFPILGLLDLQGVRKRCRNLASKVNIGTDTVAILLEWILAGMAFSDLDHPHLPYLLAIIKETIRMHPPGPLLSWARLAIHDVHIGENFIPAGTTAMVNMWAITHDEKIWSEPNEFKPERFLDEEVSIMGSDLRLAPFGSGRRVCPGKAMGIATVQLWLAQLLQSFNWVPSDNGVVDLSECLKLSLEMKKPLVCKAVYRVRC